jgi:HAD superfamily hydrolase (TIGR01509 family)
MNRVRGVLLDVDGTLVDSNDAHAEAWVRALADCGHNVPFTTVRKLIGMGGDKLLPKVAGINADSNEGKKISERRGELFLTEHAPLLRPFPGARELLLRMRERGLKLVVASSAKKSELEPLLSVCGAIGLIDGMTSADDANRSKPDPDIVREALEEIRLPADDVLMLGDTPYDVEAAMRAGVRIIAFRCGGWTDEELRGAIAVYDGTKHLLDKYDSPLLAIEVADNENYAPTENLEPGR